MIDDYLLLVEKAESSGDYFTAAMLRSMIAIPALLLLNVAILAYLHRKGGKDNEPV